MQYFRYHGYYHVVVQCPSGNLLVEEVDLDDEFGEMYKPISTSDIGEDIRASNNHLSIVQCLHIQE